MNEPDPDFLALGEAMMTVDERVTALASQVEKLAAQLQAMTAARDVRANNAALNYAFQHALQQASREVCVRLGTSEGLFSSRFQEAARWYYDYFLRRVSDSAPNLSARIDVRTLDDIPTDESPPPILDP